MVLRPSRARPADRKQTETDKRPQSQLKTYAAPTAGLVTAVNLSQAPASTAVVLDNFLPYEAGSKPRGGYVVKATTESDVTKLFQYRAGGVAEFFAADETKIYEFSQATPEGTALTATVTGQTSGEYSALETETAGGSFLTVVNGADPAQQYNGTSWSVPSFTGVSSALLSHVWAYRNRQWFIEKNTMSAWYLGVNSVSGTATEFPLAGIFNLGGVLLFGETFSSDAGDGLDDRTIFVTDQGEVAIYSGDPAVDIALQGVYRMGEPLGRDAYFKVGGDVMICTREGLIPVSAVTSKDPGALQAQAVSRSIEPDWRESVQIGGAGWSVSKYERGGFAFIAPPTLSGQVPRGFAVSLRTGAWTTITGWDANTMAVLGDYPYFGSGTSICQAETGGTDDGASFTCSICYQFDHLGAPAVIKRAGLARMTFRSRVSFNAKVSIASDYNTTFQSAPALSDPSATTDSLWDVSSWDVVDWGKGFSNYSVTSKWESVSGQGFVLAPQVQILSAGVARVDCELVSIDLTYMSGEPL